MQYNLSEKVKEDNTDEVSLKLENEELYQQLSRAKTKQKTTTVCVCVILASIWAYTYCGILYSTERNSQKSYFTVMEVVSAFGLIMYCIMIYNLILGKPYTLYFSDFTDAAVKFFIVLISFAILIMGKFKNKATKGVFLFIEIIAFLYASIYINCMNKYNFVTNIFGTVVSNKKLVVANLIMLLVINIVGVLLVSHGTTYIINEFDAPVSIYTASISVSSLILITSLLISQFNVGFRSVIISTIYLAVACLMLFVGFKKQFTVVRSGGLVLILCAFAKLCFVDSQELNSTWKILLYFVFGILLIVISYFYHRFSKKLQEKAVNAIENKAEENNELVQK